MPAPLTHHISQDNRARDYLIEEHLKEMERHVAEVSGLMGQKKIVSRFTDDDLDQAFGRKP